MNDEAYIDELLYQQEPVKSGVAGRMEFCSPLVMDYPTVPLPMPMVRQSPAAKRNGRLLVWRQEIMSFR